MNRYKNICVTNDHDMFRLSLSQSRPSFIFHDISHDCYNSNTTGTSSGAGTTFPSGAPVHSVFSLVCIPQSLF